jgi:hypothetical protein
LSLRSSACVTHPSLAHAIKPTAPGIRRVHGGARSAPINALRSCSEREIWPGSFVPVPLGVHPQVEVTVPTIGHPTRWMLELDTYGPATVGTTVAGQTFPLRPRSVVVLRASR